MNKLQGFIFASAWIFVLGYLATGCEKEVQQTEPTCNCTEKHFNYEPVNNGGVITTQWVLDYETTPQLDLCSKETGEYVYQGQAHRYIVECY